MLTLKGQLKKFLREDGGWVKKQKITDDQRWQNQRNFTYYSSPTVDRTLRKLEEESDIAVKYVDGQTMYHWMPASKKSDYIPTEERKRKGWTVYWRSKVLSV